jgi:hypothetical protein
MDGQTDRKMDRQATSPYPYTGKQEFLVLEFSTIPLTTFAHMPAEEKCHSYLSSVCCTTNNIIK